MDIYKDRDPLITILNVYVYEQDEEMLYMY